jgi:hypothetical protein
MGSYCEEADARGVFEAFAKMAELAVSQSRPLLILWKGANLSLSSPCKGE